MATYYGRAGGGNWNSASTWSLTSGGGATGSVPTAADDIRLDNLSGAITINGTSGAPSYCRDLDCTGYTNTLTNSVSGWLEIHGNLTLVAGMATSFTSGSTLVYKATTTGKTITYGGKAVGAQIFDGVGGGWTLQSAVINNSGTITLTNGSLDTNSVAVSALLSSSNSNVRSLTLGATVWTFPALGAIWNIADSTNMTFNAGTSVLQTVTNSNYTFNGGGLSYNTFISSALTSGPLTINQANTFATLTFANSTSSGTQYLFGADQIVTGTLSLTGNSSTNRIYLRSTVPSAVRTITAANVSAKSVDIQDIAGAGAANWNLSAITGLSGDCGGNSGITFTSPLTLYWVPSGGTGSGITNVNTRIATSSGGTAGSGRTPLPQDRLIFDANSFNGSGQTVNIGQGLRNPSMDFSAATNTPILAYGTGALSIVGDLILGTVTFQGSGSALTFEGRGNHTLSMNNIAISKPIGVQAGIGVYTYPTNIKINAGIGLTIASGTLQASGSASLAAGNITVSGGNLYEGTGGVSAITTLINVSSGNFGAGLGTVTTVTTFTCSGGTANIKTLTAGTAVTNSVSGVMTIGTGGMTGTALSKTGATSVLTINGASNFTSSIGFSNGGTTNINATLSTNAASISNSGQVINLNGASLTYSAGSYNPVGGSGTPVTRSYIG